MGLSGFGEGALAACNFLIVRGLGVVVRVSLCESDALSVGGLGVVETVSRCAPEKVGDAWDTSTRPSEGLSCNVTL